MGATEANIQNRVVSADNGDVARLAQGHVAAFNRLYERYHQSVYSNILKIVKAPHHAEEILQDVFVSLWQNRYRIRADQSVGGWLFVVSFNQSMTFLKRKLRDAIIVVGDYPLEIADTSESDEQERYHQQIALLEEAVSALPKRKREVFRACRYEGRSKEEVARELGISTASVGDYLKQSNQAIRAYIASRYPYATSAGLLLFYLSNGG